jgi:glycosyltransferase involved in cell wall biosynthesis
MSLIAQSTMPSMSGSNLRTLALCIPAYNAARHLPRILGSAQKQLIPFDETIVYDDASTDETRQVAESFGARVIRGERNLGCTWGRKILAEDVRSDWIHFHDADDDMKENFTTLAHAWMGKPNAPDVILFNYDWVELDTGRLVGQTRFIKNKAEEDPILFTLETQVNPFCGLYKTTKFLEAGGPDTDPEVSQCEDIAMHCKLARKGLKFSVERDLAIINYLVPGSMSRSPDSYKKLIAAIYTTYQKAFTLLKSNGRYEDYKKAIGLRMWQHTRHAAWVSQWEYVKKSIFLAKECGVTCPSDDSKSFQILCRFEPLLAVVARELFNRIRRKPGAYWY